MNDSTEIIDEVLEKAEAMRDDFKNKKILHKNPKSHEYGVWVGMDRICNLIHEIKVKHGQ